MSNARFAHIGLRTKDVAGATDFYARVLGRPVNGILQLPAIAASRGAPSHWLGFVELATPQGHSRALAQWLSRGATQLGPAVEKSGTVILRDPGGAVFAITRGIDWPGESAAWQHLSTPDAPQAARNYTDAFGWSMTELVDQPLAGSIQQFAWDAGGPDVGSIGDIAGRPEVHPHWTFYLESADLDAAAAEVAASGGRVIGEHALREGVRVVACEDPQGAEFGLISPAIFSTDIR